MIDIKKAEAKDLLVEHRRLLKQKISEMKSLKTPAEYKEWADVNKEYILKLIQLNIAIFYYFEYQIEKFTVDEDTYDLACDFIKDYIEHIDAVLDENSAPYMIETSNDKGKNEQTIVIEMNEESLNLSEVKKKYEGYLVMLNNYLPKCWFSIDFPLVEKYDLW